MTICVAYSPTAEGSAALELAVRERRLRGTKLVAVATERQERFDHEADRGDALRSEVEGRLAQLRTGDDPCDDPDADIHVVADGGDAAEAVIDLAVEAGAELLVIGVKRRSPVGKAITGSVAQRIILDSPVPVLVTHAARG